MEIKRNKYLNENIINSLAITVAALSIIGAAMELLEYTDSESFDYDFLNFDKKFISIACIVTVLVYIAQVFWLQKLKENEENNKDVFYIDIYSIVGFIFFIIATEFGTTGVYPKYVEMNPIYSYSDYLIPAAYVVIVILTALAIIKNNRKIYLFLIIISAFYIIVSGGFYFQFGIYILPLIFAFAYLDSEKNDKNNITEILYLSISAISTFIISAISFSYSVALFGFDGDYYVLPSVSVLILIIGVILYLSWKRNSLKLFITAVILEFISIMIPIVLNIIHMFRIDMMIGFNWYGIIIAPVLMAILSPNTIFFIISFVKIYCTNNRMNKVDTSENRYNKIKDIKPQAVIWIIVAVLLYAAGILIPQTINVNSFYDSKNNSVDQMVEKKIDEIVPDDDEIVYEDSMVID